MSIRIDTLRFGVNQGSPARPGRRWVAGRLSGVRALLRPSRAPQSVRLLPQKRRDLVLIRRQLGSLPARPSHLTRRRQFGQHKHQRLAHRQNVAHWIATPPEHAALSQLRRAEAVRPRRRERPELTNHDLSRSSPSMKARLWHDATPSSATWPRSMPAFCRRCSPTPGPTHCCGRSPPLPTTDSLAHLMGHRLAPLLPGLLRRPRALFEERARSIPACQEPSVPPHRLHTIPGGSVPAACLH